MNNYRIRCCAFAMDARREAQRMVIPFTSFATPQSREYAVTRRARRMSQLFINEP